MWHKRVLEIIKLSRSYSLNTLFRYAYGKTSSDSHPPPTNISDGVYKSLSEVIHTELDVNSQSPSSCERQAFHSFLGHCMTNLEGRRLIFVRAHDKMDSGLKATQSPSVSQVRRIMNANASKQGRRSVRPDTLNFSRSIHQPVEFREVILAQTPRKYARHSTSGSWVNNVCARLVCAYHPLE